MWAHPGNVGLDGQSLEAGLADFELENRQSLKRNLDAYMALLLKWNLTYNLVSPASIPNMLSKHVFDSLSVLPFLHGGRILDVGTGAGLPGMVLAMAQPQRHFTLLDANGKKIRFCRQVCAEISLPNVEIVRARVQDYVPRHGFSSIVSRAYTTVGELISQVEHLCALEAQVLVMKGAQVMAELEHNAQIPDNTQVRELRVPGIESKRYLVIVNLLRNRVT